MQDKRIMPCLDVKDGRVVKGVNFVNLTDAGDPVEIAKMYNDLLADELVLLDITATHENRDTIVSVVSKAAEQISIPLTVGGGIRTIDDIERILKAGADKISINSAAVKNPDLINEAAEKFESSRIVAAIDAKKNDSGGFDVYINGGRLNAGKDVVSWAVECEKRGFGEILLTSMDCDGVKKGYDLELTKLVSDAVRIPVIASGGAGSKEDFFDVLTKGGADAALAASLFHFREIDIKDLKEYLKSNGISVRI